MTEVNWITYRLPKYEDLNDLDEVLVTTSDGGVKVARWSGSNYNVKGAGWCQSTDVIAWAQMPKPYKEESND